MSYSDKTKELVYAAKKTTGNRLGRWAIHRDFPVTKIALCTGATRQTVYNWFAGGDMLAVYETRIQTLIKILEASDNAEQAWRQACKTFSITK
jgi:hypothetical protein